VTAGGRTPGQVAAGGLAALPLSSVPDKRQESKQRRASRNRANREALAARRENAEVAATAPSASAKATNGAGVSSGKGSSRGSGGAASPGSPAVMRPGSESVGRIATALAFVFAAVAAIAVLFVKVDVDIHGEPWPQKFGAVAKLAQARGNDGVIPDDTTSLVDAYGPSALLMLAFPVAVAAFAMWAVRRPNRSRLMTYTMLAMAGAVILNPLAGVLFFPALIAIAVAGFRVRKADLPARVAERATGTAERPSLASLFGFGGARGGARGRGDVIDVDAEDVTDADADAEPEDAPTAEDDAAGATPPTRRSRRARRATTAAATAEGDDTGGGDGPTDADPLAELEAEVQAEIEAERSAGDDGAGGGEQPGR
jgi:hypothetical protein